MMSGKLAARRLPIKTRGQTMKLEGQQQKTRWQRGSGAVTYVRSRDSLSEVAHFPGTTLCSRTVH